MCSSDLYLQANYASAGELKFRYQTRSQLGDHYNFDVWVDGQLISVVPRALRMNFLVRLIMPCRLPAWPLITLPVAETLKRFLALDLVFILGISISFFRAVHKPTRRATLAGGSVGARRIQGKVPPGKRKMASDAGHHLDEKLRHFRDGISTRSR